MQPGTMDLREGEMCECVCSVGVVSHHVICTTEMKGIGGISRICSTSNAQSKRFYKNEYNDYIFNI